MKMYLKCFAVVFVFGALLFILAPPVDFTRKPIIQKISNGESLDSCKWKGWNGKEFQFHPIGLINTGGTVTTSKLLEDINNIWFSSK